MPRPKKNIHDLKSKQIKINVTKSDLERFNIKKNRLSSFSPTLSANDILRIVVNNIDDIPLIQFLQLEKNDPIRVFLLNDFSMSKLKNMETTLLSATCFTPAGLKKD